MTTICAVPYDTSASAFYFSSITEYDEKYTQRLPVEEYEMQFIDGDNPKLFNESDISQANINLWFQALDDIEDDSDASISIRYLTSLGYSLSDAIHKKDEVAVFHGKPSDYAYEIFSDSEIPDYLSNYIDYDAIARDLELSGEICEFSSEVIITNAHDF